MNAAATPVNGTGSHEAPDFLDQPEDAGLPPDIGQRPANTMVRAVSLAWPAFVMAGVLEMLVFAVVDPGDLRWFGGELIGWSSQAIYTVTFLIFWLVMTLSNGVSLLLRVEDVAGASPTKPRGLARHWP